MAVDLVWLAIATLLAPVFAEYAKIRIKAEHAFNWIAGAGIFFLLAVSFETNLFLVMVGATSVYGSYLFQFLGWLFLLIGVLWAVFGGLMKK